MTITEDGTVVEGLHIRGSVTVEADDVIIRNSLIQTDTSLYPVRVADGAANVLIENVEIDNMGGTGIGIFFNGGTGHVVGANIHSSEDGIRIQSDDVVIERSYIHDLQRQSGGHHDCIQIRRGDNVTITGNTLMAYVGSSDDPLNAAIQIGSLSGDDRITNLRVTGNYMNGGNFTFNGGGRGEIESAVISGNRFGRDYRYGVIGNMDGDAVSWEADNVWDDTGRPAS
ncbi:MAG: right-handed parallel beta-helix repeat-containing protein [Nocardioides sp.]|uniref:right-handed parallel beta-helix repeat-containing protein n=1 Tax=Nocardioides sp. TaxID=35761 RepID=UPI003EFC528A